MITKYVSTSAVSAKLISLNAMPVITIRSSAQVPLKHSSRRQHEDAHLQSFATWATCMAGARSGCVDLAFKSLLMSVQMGSV